jgi:NADPH:quinone reductase-like Zn-dependent oxidoreductase
VFWSRKRTSLYFVSRDHPTFEPELNALFELLSQGKIDAPIKAVYDLEDIRDAHRNWGKGAGVGSVVIRIGAEGGL